jgi:cell division protein FtsA
VLRNDERELGVCLADIGAGSTETDCFQQGAVAYTGVIPVGGDHFTSDLSVGPVHALAEAEKIKKVYGNAIVTLIPEGNEVEVPSVGDRRRAAAAAAGGGDSRAAGARTVRADARTLRQSGMYDVCIAGIVLTGGASRLPGIFDVSESVLRRSVRLSWPAPLAKMPSTLSEPEFATVLGMVNYGQRARTARGMQEDRWGTRLKALLVGRERRSVRTVSGPRYQRIFRKADAGSPAAGHVEIIRSVPVVVSGRETRFALDLAYEEGLGVERDMGEAILYKTDLSP